MNLMELATTLGATFLRALLVRYFPFQPFVFDSTTTPADYYDFIVGALGGRTGGDGRMDSWMDGRTNGGTNVHLDKYHGFKGPLAVRRKTISTKLVEQFLDAGRQMGYSVIDPNGAQQIGGSPPYITVLEGVSATASESFVTPIVGRRNLLVKTGATVRRVLFNQSKRAVGVQYSINGKSHVVMARKEVILSAGAINSPKILMLSGVGPKQHLEEIGVRVVAAVEGVGKNLQDHVGPHLPYYVKSSAVSSPFELITVESLKSYWTSQTGTFAEPILGDGYFWLNVADQEHPNWTDIILGIGAISPVTLGAEGTISRNNMRAEIFQEVYGELSNGTVFVYWVTLARPKSTGSVTLSSSSPDATPVVEANVFDHPDDMKVLIKGIRKAKELSSMPALKNVVEVKEPSRLISPCRHHGRDSDAYWECYIRHVTSAGFYLTSSVKMAPPSDPLGVVSTRLRVRGVTGLRVIDASIMPQIVTVEPMAATYMIAEKGADMIKEDWGYPTGGL